MKEHRRMVMKSSPMSLDLPKIVSYSSNQTTIQCTCGHQVTLEKNWGLCDGCSLYLRYDPGHNILEIYELVEFVRDVVR